MRRNLVTISLALVAVLLLPSLSKADTFTYNWDEVNGTYYDYSYTPPYPSIDAGAPTTGTPLPFSVPAGQAITSASFSSTFGNTTVSSTTSLDVFVNGVNVGSCTDACWATQAPTPFNYNFTSAQFASLIGPLDLSIDQTDWGYIRLGASTLTINTSPVATPEPGTLALLAIGLFGLFALPRRKLAAFRQEA